jgi:hypothetical protein
MSTSRLGLVVAVVTAACGGKSGEPRPTGLSFASAPESLVRGLRVELAVREQWSDGSRRAVTSPLSWSSSHPGIVSVSEGLVRGLAPGDAIVTASSAAFTASLPIHVHRERIVFVETGPRASRVRPRVPPFVL